LIERFIGYLGHSHARAIGRQNVVDSLLGGAISNLTIRDAYLASVRATLQFGVDLRQESRRLPVYGSSVLSRDLVQPDLIHAQKQ
jgi:hypothetical protein